LLARVIWSDGSLREFHSPFQNPKYAGIAAALHDLNGDGTVDSIRFTARLGKKKVSRVVLIS
jgi:hypothetical protein